MTDLEYIKSAMTDLERMKSALADLEQIKWARDSLTEFVPTKKDLEDLANALADDVVNDDFFLRLCVSRSDIDRREYASFRLERILDHLPELRPEIETKLKRGFRKNEAAAKQWEAEEAEEPHRGKTTTPFSVTRRGCSEEGLVNTADADHRTQYES